MTDLFDHIAPAPVPASAASPRPTSGRRPTLGESACNRCGFAACFFDGATPWCFEHAPAEFRPGRVG